MSSITKSVKVERQPIVETKAVKIAILPVDVVDSIAPRVEGSGEGKRFEFKCLEDVVSNMEQGYLVGQVLYTVRADKTPQLYLVFKYSDEGEGNVCWALKSGTFEEQESYKKDGNQYIYKLLQQTDRNYMDRVAHEDSSETFARFMSYLAPQLQAVKEMFYTEMSSNLNLPKSIKFDVPKKSNRVISQDNAMVKVVNTTFDMEGHIRAPGKVLVRVSSPWLMVMGKELNVLMGVKIALCHYKYLSMQEKTDKEEDAKKTRESNKRKADDMAEENVTAMLIADAKQRKK